MTNNKRLEYQLIKKSNLVDRAPTSTTSDNKYHVDNYDKCECGCREKNIHTDL
jgi:hypothetical protein